MNGPGHQQIWIYALIVGLIAWRLYARFRRSVGRQHLSRVRPWITVMVFPVLLVLLALPSIGTPLPLAALAGGVAAGIALGIYGHRLTKYEVTPQGMYYTPSAHIGIGLSLLMVLRIGYRALQGGLVPPPGGSHPPPASTPTTLLIFGALAGYYVTYAIGLLMWRHRVTNAPAAAAPAGESGGT